MIAVVAVSLSLASMTAQDIALRVREKVLNSAGAPVAKARVQTDATLGPQGAPFGSASRNFSATTNDKGEWGILGVTRGVWIFEGSPAGHVPTAVSVPVKADEAVDGYSRARTATADKSLQQVMSAAIADLQKLGRTRLITRPDAHFVCWPATGLLPATQACGSSPRPVAQGNTQMSQGLSPH